MRGPGGAPATVAEGKTGPIASDTEQEVAADFVATFESHYGRMVRAMELSGLDRATAEDVAQEAFARSLNHWDRVRQGSNPAGYVYRTAFRLARRNLRAIGREAPLVEAAARGDVSEEASLRVTAQAALAAMPARRRSCAVMCLVLGLTTKEAARALGIAEGTVRKQLELARKAISEAVARTA